MFLWPRHGSVLKILSKSVHNFLSNLPDRQTDRHRYSWARTRGAQLTARYTVNMYSKPPLYYTAALDCRDAPAARGQTDRHDLPTNQPTNRTAAVLPDPAVSWELTKPSSFGVGNNVFAGFAAFSRQYERLRPWMTRPTQRALLSAAGDRAFILHLQGVPEKVTPLSTTSI